MNLKDALSICAKSVDCLVSYRNNNNINNNTLFSTTIKLCPSIQASLSSSIYSMTTHNNR